MEKKTCGGKQDLRLSLEAIAGADYVFARTLCTYLFVFLLVSVITDKN